MKKGKCSALYLSLTSAKEEQVRCAKAVTKMEQL